MARDRRPSADAAGGWGSDFSFSFILSTTSGRSLVEYVVDSDEPRERDFLPNKREAAEVCEEGGKWSLGAGEDERERERERFWLSLLLLLITAVAVSVDMAGMSGLLLEKWWRVGDWDGEMGVGAEMLMGGGKPGEPSELRLPELL